MKTTCSTRKMQESDIQDLFKIYQPCLAGREEILTRYFKEQESGESSLSRRG